MHIKLSASRIRKMVSSELGQEIEKNVFRLVTSVGQRFPICRIFLCLTLVTRRKTSFSEKFVVDKSEHK